MIVSSVINNKKTYSPAGTKQADDFGYVNEKGRTFFKKVGQTNIFEKIQSFKDSNSLAIMIQKYQSGDTSVLTTKTEYYGDFTKMPTSLTEIQNNLLQAKEIFAKLPKEIRKHYNYNIDEFTTGLFSGEFEKYLNEVKNDETIKKTNQILTKESIKEVSASQSGSSSTTSSSGQANAATNQTNSQNFTI